MGRNINNGELQWIYIKSVDVSLKILKLVIVSMTFDNDLKQVGRENQVETISVT